MKNLEVASIFYEIADILEMQSVAWKPIAYRRAAKVLESMTEDVSVILEKKGIKGLMELPGIGEALAKKIEEYVQTGKIKEYERVKKIIPSGVKEMLHIQGLGPKKVFRLYKELKIKNVKELEIAAKAGKIRKMEGFGEKSEEEILNGLELLKKGRERMLLGTALQIARELENTLKSLKEVQRVQVAGSVRRRRETVKDIDILVISKNAKKVMDFFTTMSDVERILAKGPTKTSVILKQGLNSDVRVLDDKNFGAALQYFTGNKDHNIKLRQIAIKKGLKLNEYGLFNSKTNKYICGRTEEEIYKKLGLNYVEPELRENLGEIEQNLKLPKIIPYNSLRGDLHLHTKWSDGNNTTEEMVKSAIKMNYDYVAITDHSKSEYIANGLDAKRLLKHIKEIEQIQKKYPQIKIFKGSEVDILKDGKLDYDDKILKQLDFVIASVHSRFKSEKQEMTKRIITAIENKYVNAIGHPTGRLINTRNPYEADLDKIFNAAKQNNVLMEINSSPERLDLKDIHIKQAKEIGVKFVINTDSHSTEHYRNIELGIAQARRGWVTADDVVNTLPLKKFEKFIRVKR